MWNSMVAKLARLFDRLFAWPVAVVSTVGSPRRFSEECREMTPRARHARARVGSF
jgi:hypothetical protein